MAFSATSRLLPALALLAAGCSALPSSSQEAGSPIPDPPEVVEGVPDPVPAPPEDGLFRFIIRPPFPLAPEPADPWADAEAGSDPWSDADADVDADPWADADADPDPWADAEAGSDPWADAEAGSDPWSDADAEPDPWADAEAESMPGQPMATEEAAAADETPVAPPPDPAWTLDQTLAAQIDGDTVIVIEDGIPGFYAGGVFVPLVGNSTASSGAPTSTIAPTLTEQDFIDELLEVEEIISVVPVGDGTYAVAAEDPEVLDGQGLSPIVDIPFALAGDPYEPYQWTLDNTGDNLAGLSNPPAQSVDADIDGLEAKAGARGDGIVVAVIDTGVDFSHPDLAGQSWVNEDETCNNLIDDDGNGFVDDCAGWDFGNEDNQPFETGQKDHGTHVAGTIAAIADNGVGVVGMAPEVTIMDLNVEGPGGMTMSGISRAIRYAADNGADVINLSLGTQPGTPAAAVTGLIDAVRYAEARGALVVAAAGNSSVDLDRSPVFPANIEGPNMITVGASAPDETKAGFSNYGSPVDVFAPGVLIVSTVPGGGYKFMNGTSMAAPTVAGAAAAVLSAFPDLDPLGVREQLVGTGDEAPAYQGQATNPVRINQAWAVGLDGDPEVAQVSVSGLVEASIDGVEATISMSDPAGEYAEPFQWEASLVALNGGQAYGIVDHPVNVDWEDRSTDDQGAVVIATAEQDQARLATQLPPGTYALVIEAVPEDDPTMRLGDAFVSTFVVPVEPEPEPEPEPGPEPDDGATTTPTTTTPTTNGPTTTWDSSTLPWPPPADGPGSGPSTTQPATSTPTPTSGPATTVTGTPTTVRQVGPTFPTSAPAPTSAPSPTTISASTSRPVTAPAPTSSPPAPTPTAPASSAPPSTAPAPTWGPTTSVAATPTTVPWTPAPTSTAPPTTSADGGFAIHRISPTAGYSNQQTMVSIDGTFPSMVNVWFGDQPGGLVHHSSSWIIVVAPTRAKAGPVDITLRSNTAGTVLLASAAFTYLDPAGGGSPVPPTTVQQQPDPAPSTTAAAGSPAQPTTSAPSTGVDVTPTTIPGGTVPTSTPGDDGGTGGGTPPNPTSPSPSTSTIDGAQPTTIPPGSPTTTTATDPSTTMAADGSTTTTEPPGLLRQARAGAAGDPVGLPGGLQGVPLGGLGDLGAMHPCISEPCRTRRI